MEVEGEDLLDEESDAGDNDANSEAIDDLMAAGTAVSPDNAAAGKCQSFVTHYSNSSYLIS